MTRSAATQIAGYLTTGFYRDMGYAAPPFDRQAGDGLTVWMDLSDRADRGIVRLALDAWSTVTGLRFALDGRAITICASPMPAGAPIPTAPMRGTAKGCRRW